MGCHCFPRQKWGQEYDHFIATVFRVCAYTWVQELSFWLGIANLGFWLFAQVPQIVENHVKDEVEGLSPTFIFIWLCGDVTNLIGCILTNQTQVQLITAIYFCSMDVIMLGQMGIIGGKQMLRKLLNRLLPSIFPLPQEPANNQIENNKNKENEATPLKKSPSLVINDPENPAFLLQNPVISSNEESMISITPISPLSELEVSERPKSNANSNLLRSFALIFLGVSGSLIIKNSNIFSSFSSPERSFSKGIRRFRLLSYDDESYDPHPENGCDYIAPYSMFSRIIGDICAWTSGVLYFASRFPQAWLNYKRKSVEGLSFPMFLLSMCANVCYGLSIIIPGVTDWFVFMENVFPYLLGSLFTQFASGIIVIQFFLYSWWPSWKKQYKSFKPKAKFLIDFAMNTKLFSNFLGTRDKYENLPDADENNNNSEENDESNIKENEENVKIKIEIPKKLEHEIDIEPVISTSLKKARRNYATIADENEEKEKQKDEVQNLNSNEIIPKNLSSTDLFTPPYGTFG